MIMIQTLTLYLVSAVSFMKLMRTYVTYIKCRKLLSNIGYNIKPVFTQKKGIYSSHSSSIFTTDRYFLIADSVIGFILHRTTSTMYVIVTEPKTTLAMAHR